MAASVSITTSEPTSAPPAMPLARFAVLDSARPSPALASRASRVQRPRARGAAWPRQLILGNLGVRGVPAAIFMILPALRWPSRRPASIWPDSTADEEAGIFNVSSVGPTPAGGRRTEP